MPRRPKVIAKSLNVMEGGRKTPLALLALRVKGAVSRGPRAASRSCRRQGLHPRSSTDARFYPGETHFTETLCCFKSLHVWQFVTAATGNSVHLQEVRTSQVKVKVRARLSQIKTRNSDPGVLVTAALTATPLLCYGLGQLPCPQPSPRVSGCYPARVIPRLSCSLEPMLSWLTFSYLQSASSGSL